MPLSFCLTCEPLHYRNTNAGNTNDDVSRAGVYQSNIMVAHVVWFGPAIVDVLNQALPDAFNQALPDALNQALPDAVNQALPNALNQALSNALKQTLMPLTRTTAKAILFISSHIEYVHPLTPVLQSAMS